jgi:sulfane dehydrogenase subunit SoxC
VLSKAFTRFRMPWQWDGREAILQSRATDEAGHVQPSREAFIAERGPPRSTPNVAAFPMEHCNMIVSWGIGTNGEVSHVYA